MADRGAFRQYPKCHGPEEDRGFSADEITRGIHALYMDYECPCGKVQSVATMGGIGANCIACGRPSTGTDARAQGGEEGRDASAHR